jgi:hypothetical protein
MNLDNALRKFFEEMKHQDASDAPLFHQCLPHTEQAERPRPANPYLMLAMAAAALIAAGTLFFQEFQKKPTLPENNFEQWAALSVWQPASDQLVAENLPLHANEISTPTDNFFENPTPNATPHSNL